MSMNPEVKARWIEALRSGRYKQATGVLEEIQDDGTSWFCCLGVLCDVIPEVKATRRVQNGVVYYGNEGVVDVLPQLAIKLSDVGSISPSPANAPEESLSLAGLNDAGHTFEQIAKLVEEL